MSDKPFVNVNVSQLLRDKVEKNTDKQLYVFCEDGVSISYAQFYERVSFGCIFVSNYIEKSLSVSKS